MSKDTKKIVIIGAGSAEFGLKTLAGIMRTKAFNGIELALVDTNEENIKKMKKLAEIINDKWQSNMKIIATTNRREVLNDADSVIISIAVNREEFWKRDYEIALKYGISHRGEDGGPGAFALTARNLFIILPILDDIKELCPNTFILNFTKPNS